MGCGSSVKVQPLAENPKPKNVENTKPKTVENTKSKNVENTKPKNVENTKPKNVENTKPKNVENDDNDLSKSRRRRTSVGESIIRRRKDSTTSIVTLDPRLIVDNIHTQTSIVPLDPDAFNSKLRKQRQAAIENDLYRNAINSWQPTSIEHLVNLIKTLSLNKSDVDKTFIIYYWICQNIEYDVISYFSKNYADQTAEGVFRTKKGVCAGYGNIFQRLCDGVSLQCVKISGYSKGYKFDPRTTTFKETDHAWNSVQIDNHWYIIESTWGAGNLNDNKQFKKQFDPYYFFCPPEEFIYDHLPKDEKWQLLVRPISMQEYLSMPVTWSSFFELKLELISSESNILQLINGKPYAQVQIRSPIEVDITANLKLNDKKIDGGDRVCYDPKQKIWCCYFAPQSDGPHEITIYAKRKNQPGSYKSAVKFSLEVLNLTKPISFPGLFDTYYDLDLKIVQPKFQHTIQLKNDVAYTEILLQAPKDVKLIGDLTNPEGKKVDGGEQVYFDKQKALWRCLFAPQSNGLHEITIYAQRTNQSGSYKSAVKFSLEVLNLTKPISFPGLFDTYYDLDLKIIQPKFQHIIQLKNDAAYTEILLQAPKDVKLIGDLRNPEGKKVDGSHRLYFDKQKALWRCLFAPQSNGLHEITIYAKRKNQPGSFEGAVKFRLQAHNLTKPISFPRLLDTYYDLDLKIVQPKFQHTIQLKNDAAYTEILLQAPKDVKLIGDLTNPEGKKVHGGEQVYFDKQKALWRCLFAPQKTGLHKINIYAKKASDNSTSYSAALEFNLNVQQLPSNIISYPNTMSLFYDYDLKIIAPNNSRFATWPKNASYTEILLRAPNNIQLSGHIFYDNQAIDNGSLIQYDHDKQLWQCLFAPRNTGLHKIIVFAKENGDSNTSQSVVDFDLDVTNLKRSIAFPKTYALFQKNKCKIYEPFEMKKGSNVTLHCRIPDANNVRILFDSKPEREQEDDYENNIFKRQITVPNQNVVIMGNYTNDTSYSYLIHYTVT
ncbi:unnamed protein product [Didymodactylos carnosus]|uniref:Transglutaminase-like domain-containing protein n=1 Tax=Didymodactylos carnosus TaxID=1234261 RepID=A0A813Z4G4_9BILA|nr:unnamed protein product [Didymodactylos carnosus]CAF3677256.1 unnamed protein product [Didymodactylos carnosus]